MILCMAGIGLLRPHHANIVKPGRRLMHGIPLRFANTTQNTSTGWLTLGTV